MRGNRHRAETIDLRSAQCMNGEQLFLTFLSLEKHGRPRKSTVRGKQDEIRRDRI